MNMYPSNFLSSVSFLTMGADWYSTFVVFGCSVTIPKDKSYTQVFNKLSNIDMEEPFHVYSMLSEFHSRMEGMTDDERDSMTEYAEIVIGFVPSKNMATNCELSEKLKAYLAECEALQKYSFGDPKFHTGIDWYVDDDDGTDDDGTDEEEIHARIQPAKTNQKVS